MERQQITKAETNKAISEVTKELNKQLRAKGRGTYASSHEIYGILAEEMKELLDEVQSHDFHKVDRICKELAQIGVACIFGIASIRAGGVDWL